MRGSSKFPKLVIGGVKTGGGGGNMRASRKQRLDMPVLMMCLHHLKTAEHKTG